MTYLETNQPKTLADFLLIVLNCQCSQEMKRNHWELKVTL